MVTKSKKSHVYLAPLAAPLILGLMLSACGPSKKNSTAIDIGSNAGSTTFTTDAAHLAAADGGKILAQSKISSSSAQLSGEIVAQDTVNEETDAAADAAKVAGAESEDGGEAAETTTSEVKDESQLYKVSVNLPTGENAALVTYVVDVTANDLKSENQLQLNMTKQGESEATDTVRIYFLDTEMTVILVEVSAASDNGMVYTFLSNNEDKLVYQYETQISAEITTAQIISNLKSLVNTETNVTLEGAVTQRKVEISNPQSKGETAGNNGRAPRARVDESALKS